MQIVYAAHAVPYLEPGCIATEQNTADSNHRVGLRTPKLRQLRKHLAALTLVDGVEDQRRHTVKGQQRPHCLIGLIPLCIAAVAAGHQHAGVWRFVFLGIRQKQHRADIVLRLALEDDFLCLVAVAIDYARDPRIQRRSLRQGADSFKKFAAKPLLILGYLLRRFDLLVLCLPVLEPPSRLVPQVMIHHVACVNVID
ncbi:hypothetical protein ES703_106470 [subsurface metagenome]